MKWLLRPSMLVLLSVVLLGAAVVVLWPRSQEIRAAPLRDDESEIVWLYPATNASWERFVTAVHRAAERLQADYPDLEVRSDDGTYDTFPRQTTAHPELALTVRHGSARLVFRWYKLTADQRADQWVAALLDGSRRPPLAVVGGNSSEQAKEIAASLRDRAGRVTKPPLLLLTTATADRVPVGEAPGDVALNELHRDRTFRFCFTNQQMAGAVTEFVWGREELRPDADPVYVAEWADDAYSVDLTGRFCQAQARPRAARDVGREWAWAAGAPATGAFPLDLAALFGDTARNPTAEIIDYSVGGFDQPNRWEAPAVKRLMETKIAQFPRQRRPLLVLAAPRQEPARRFLRGLARTAPAEARRFVVVTGDALSFNTVYRDRNALWPIQDLPFELVFFCHRNPVDADAGFREESHPPGTTAPATGTEDLLLYRDIVEALVQAVNQGGAMPADGDELGRRLRQARWHDGRVSFDDQGPELFDDSGNRRGGTGEHVVWLRPLVQGERVLPQATIEVYEWQDAEAGGSWQPLRALDVDYDEPAGQR